MLRKMYREQILRNQCEEIIRMFESKPMTIRMCSENVLLSKSTVHKRIHDKIAKWYPEDYHHIVNVLRYNKTYLARPRSSWKSR